MITFSSNGMINIFEMKLVGFKQTEIENLLRTPGDLISFGPQKD